MGKSELLNCFRKFYTRSFLHIFFSFWQMAANLRCVEFFVCFLELMSYSGPLGRWNCDQRNACMAFLLCQWAWGSWGAAGVSISRGPQGRMTCGRKLSLCGITSLGFQRPFPLVQSRRRCGWEFSRGRSKASGHSFLPMVPLGSVWHQASCSPLAHCVWHPHGCGTCGRNAGA